MIRTLPIFCVFIASAGAAEVIDRVDKAAAGFKSLSANMKRVSHNGVINDDEMEEGSIAVKRAKNGDLRMLVNIQKPDPKTVAFAGKKLEIYLPKIATVQEMDVGKHRGMLEQFFLLGFGTSKRDLERDFVISEGPPETISGQKTIRIGLVPKSAETLKHLKRAELWIGDGGYPYQQKFYQSGGDYHVVTYSDLKINPELPDAALKLKLPSNVKRENLQK